MNGHESEDRGEVSLSYSFSHSTLRINAEPQLKVLVPFLYLFIGRSLSPALAFTKANKLQSVFLGVKPTG